MKTDSIFKIILKNTFTLFNLVNIILAAMVAFVGSYKNMLFIFIALANTLISIINEIRAKKIVDKLKLLSEKSPIVLKDGKQITVPTKEKEAAHPDAPKPATKPQSAKTSKVNAKININTADEAELEKLPGVGPVTAKKIVEYRNNNGKFADIEDIKKVRGIGEGRFAKMKDMIET